MGHFQTIIHDRPNSGWSSSYGQKTISAAMVEGFGIFLAWKMVNPKEYWVK
jgi:hypothetical protein